MPGLEGTSLGRYRLKRRLGRGGMAEVYLATDERMHREVAVKIVRSGNTEFITRFDREAQAMGKLHHDHILPAYDYGEQDPWHYLVMPYIEHGTLSNLLQKGPLSPEHAGELLQQVAAGLQYAHQQNILHRDIKPSNILLRDDHYAYLADFGLARAQEGASDLTQTGTLLGTPEYMAPELAEGPATVSSDIYALAIVLYQMLSGRTPFHGETAISIFWKHVREYPPLPSSFNPTLSKRVDQVLMRALEKDPSRRYTTPLALSQAYEEAISGLTEMPSLYDTEIIEDSPLQPARPGPLVLNPGEQAKSPQIPTQPVATQQSRPTNEYPSLRSTQANVLRQSFTPTTDQFAPTSPTRVPPPLPNGRRRRRNSRVVGSIAIGVAFVLVAVSILAFFTIQGGRQNNIASTATAIANTTGTVRTSQTQQALATEQGATATAQTAAANTQAQQTAIAATATTQVQATQTAVAATATAQAQAQATQTAIVATATAITASTPMVSDPLSGQDSNNWPLTTACQFQGSIYVANVNSANTLQPCISGRLHYGDAAIQVNATLISGDSAGIVFRASANGSQFYDFEITGDSHFYLRALNNGKSTTLIPSTANNAILSKGNTNTLLVIARGNDFQLFVNSAFVGETHDNTFASGNLGVAASTATSTSGVASFDSLNIYQA